MSVVSKEPARRGSVSGEQVEVATQTAKEVDVRAKT